MIFKYHTNDIQVSFVCVYLRRADHIIASSFFNPMLMGNLIKERTLGTNIANVGSMMRSKALNIQPTIEIRQGYEFNIQVTKDIVFIKPYDTHV